MFSRTFINKLQWLVTQSHCRLYTVHYLSLTHLIMYGCAIEPLAILLELETYSTTFSTHKKIFY